MVHLVQLVMNHALVSNHAIFRLVQLEMTVGKSHMPNYMLNFTLLSCTNISPNPFPSFSRHFSTVKEQMLVLAMRGKLEMTAGKSASDYFDASDN